MKEYIKSIYFIEELLIIREQKVILFPIVVKGFLFFIVFFVI